MSIYINSYTGYVYLWYDTKAKFFYIGGHYGKVEDSYVCSNKPMKRAYKLRPETFKMRVLEYITGDTKSLRKVEQYWLNMIKDNELMISENVQKGTCRYYNVKKNSTGGNGKGTNKGKSSIGGWNKGKIGAQTHSATSRQKMSDARLLWWANKNATISVSKLVAHSTN